MQKQPAVVLYDGCSIGEIMDFLYLFEAQKPAFLVAGKAEGAIRTTEGLVLVVEATAVPSRARDYDPVIVTGGDVGSVIGDSALMAFLETAAAEGALLGGICNGAWILARAGLLRGKRCTHTGHESCQAPAELIATAAPLFENAEYVAEDVVIDGSLITAKPWAKAEFAVQLARMSNILSEERVPFVRDYLRGDVTF